VGLADVLEQMDTQQDLDVALVDCMEVQVVVVFVILYQQALMAQSVLSGLVVLEHSHQLV
jgi:hypothetical protein